MAQGNGWPVWYELIAPDAAAAAPFYKATLGWNIAEEGMPLPNGSNYRMIARADGGSAGGLLTLTPDMAEMGMPLPDVVAASTVNAAMALRRPELGSLKAGSAGDATIIQVREGRFDYVDVVGEHLTGDRKIASEAVVIAGRWWHQSKDFKAAG